MISRTIRKLKRRASPPPKPAGARVSETYVTIRPNSERFAQAHEGAASAFQQLADLTRRRFEPGDRAYTLPSVVLRQDRADFRQAPIDKQCRWTLTIADPAHAGVTVNYGCEKWDGHAGEHRSSFVAPETVGAMRLAWAEHE